MKRGALALLLALYGASPAWALTSAWVSWVMDGDTVLLLPEGQHEALKWRITGIDAPEICQSGGEAAREALVARVMRRTVQSAPQGQDVYGRQIGRLLRDGQDVGAEMVAAGMAWAWQHRTGRGPYATLQRQAQRDQRGLFAVRETAMSPAVFRQFHGSCHSDEDKKPGAPVQRVPQTGQAGSR